MAGEDTIVQEVQIEGADEAASEFSKIGDAAEEGFGRVATAADKATTSLDAAGEAGGNAASKISQGLNTASSFSRSFDQLKEAASGFGSALGNAGAAVGSFVTRVGVVAGVASGAIGGILALASSMNTQTRSTIAVKSALEEQSDSLRANNIRLRQASQVLVELQSKLVTNARAWRDLSHEQGLATTDLSHKQSLASSELQRQLELGRISQIEFDKQKIDALHADGVATSELLRTQLIAADELSRSQREDAADTIKLQAIHREATEKRIKEMKALQLEQEKLDKKLEARAALNKFIDRFGSDLTTSLLQLGNAAEDFWRRFTQGPSIVARAVDFLTGFLESSGRAIIEFADRIGAAIASIFDFKNGEEAIQSASSTFKAFGEFVVSTIESFVVPAIKVLIAILNQVAEAINGLFGTKLSGGALLLIGILIRLTGAIGLVSGAVGILTSAFGLARAAVLLLSAAFGPWGLIITAVALALIFLSTQVDWKQLAADAKKAVDDTTAWFEALPGRILGFFAGLWDRVKQGASDAWAWVQQKAQDAWDAITGLWATLKDKLSKVWDDVKQDASDAWTFIRNGFQDAIDRVIGFFQRIVDKLLNIIGLSGQAGAALDAVNSADNGPGQGFARGGIIRGRGTATSDSILARLSNGEFVMKTAAVQRYGLGFMHAINQMRFNMPAFSTGGLVDALTPLFPQFAGGGLVATQGAAQGRPVILNIGGESFSLITRDGATAEQLGRFATKRRLASNGRKPSYFGS
jgi:phage-related protein